MNEKVINASTIFTPDVRYSVLHNRNARDAAIERCRQQTKAIIDQAIEYLNDNPGTVFTGVDIADTTGIPRSTVNKEMTRAFYSGRVDATRVSITRHFAQIDEDGQLVPGGRTYNQIIQARGYKKREGRNR